MLQNKYVAILIICGIVLIWMMFSFTDISHYFSLHKVGRHYQDAALYVQQHPYLAPIAFVGLYWLCISCALPVASFFAVLGGIFFPQPYATIYAMLGAFLGSMTLFSLSSYIFKRLVRPKVSDYIDLKTYKLHRKQTRTLLLLRILSFPYSILSIGSALVKIPAATFAWTTLVGILPTEYIHAEIGTAVQSGIENGQTLSQIVNYDSNIQIALFGLGILFLISILCKKQ
jgi:uncharacterized membrane protein YdjX (TVP38/TMEM64 family)